MELCANEVRVVLDLEDLHALTRLVLAHKVETCLLQTLDVLRVDLVSMTVTLLNFLGTSVQSTDLGPVAAGLKDGLARAETHGAAHVVLVEFGHRNDNTISCCSVEFLRVGTSQATQVACELDSGSLETETDLEITSV